MSPTNLHRPCFTLLYLLAALIAAGCSGGDTNSDPDRPNFIIILADDLGYADVGSYWQITNAKGHEKIHTPNIDRMAREGVRFTSFYMGSSVCSPARAALLTGCYPPRVGLSQSDEGTVMRQTSRGGLNPDETTIAETLGARGYVTACIGKWHLGHRDEFLPTRQGFDSYYGLMFRSKNGNRLMRDEAVVDTVGDAELTALYTEEAIRFIQDNRNRPFFLYLAHSMPHVPLAVSPKFEGRSRRGLYGDVIMELDDSTGRILDALAELGLDDNTLVIFTSDNGPALRQGDHGGKAYPLRDGKGWVWEGGFRVPFVVRWPGRVMAGVDCDEIATAMDLLPTLCGLAGAVLPAATIDGRDIWPLMTDSTAASPHEAFYYYHTNRLHGIRVGPWKLRFQNDRTEKDGVVPAEPMALYNLDRDIGETNSLLVGHADIAEELNRMADKMRRALGDDITGWPGEEIRPAGKSEE